MIVSFYAYNPISTTQKTHQTVFNSDTVSNMVSTSFGCRAPYATKPEPEYVKKGNELKQIHELPCLYCGRPMLNTQYSEYLSNILSIAKGGDLVDILENKFKYMTEPKKRAAELIREQAKIDKTLTLVEIVEKIEPKAKIRLQTKQLAVIENVNEKFLGRLASSFKDRKIFDDIISEGARLIVSVNPKEKFRRKNFLEYAEKELSGMNNKKAAEAIYKALLALPTSQTDEDAFIVKYATYNVEWAKQRMKANGTLQEGATDKQIKAHALISALFIDSWSTFEHIRPRALYDEKNHCWKTTTTPWFGDVADVIENIGIVCHRDNIEKGSIPLKTYIKQHPGIKKNFEKYLTTILRETGNVEYVNAMRRTLAEASKDDLELRPEYLPNTEKKASKK